ncbi:DUF998 domain-containing protein [Micromonospora sp. WMMA1976]|uniref:DUF998 domain-containing protein n=1 Tax=unclassified Micromonospora TaxID=2617518 RepID=UPI00188ED25E|nr:DUF998 domain-containing protein [Micromonospora sp. WMMA1976]MBF5029648.1 DUF998 domain-containing protein [Micromonospora sp. ANENR4]WBC04465.1 DUF998 domain-containing protein [Micromonospora sp. WMMA1976]
MAEDTARRIAAAFAGVCLAAGVAAVTVAVVAGPGPGPAGYVSEAGITDSGYAGAYRIGIFSVAASLLLLAGALPPGLRGAAGLLGVGAVATVLSGAVTCSEGCPLPPFEAPTVADLVHGGASIAATAAVVLAMLVVLFSPAADRGLRRIAAVGAALALPVAVVVAAALLLVGRSALLGVSERVLLVVVAAWGLITSGYLAVRSLTGDGPSVPTRDGSNVSRR